MGAVDDDGAADGSLLHPPAISRPVVNAIHAIRLRAIA
jgi:hypothetical protein